MVTYKTWIVTPLLDRLGYEPFPELPFMRITKLIAREPGRFLVEICDEKADEKWQDQLVDIVFTQTRDTVKRTIHAIHNST